MKPVSEESRKYAEEAFEIVEHASLVIGPRLPGSEGERKFHDYMADKLKEIGIKPVKEEFSVAPRGAIGGLPYAGVMCLIISILCWFAAGIHPLWFGMALACICTWIWILADVLCYHTWFDMFFPQKISQNTYGELLPPDGKYDYTIILSGHTDTSWNWKHSERSFYHRKNPIVGMVATYARVAFAAVCFIIVTVISLFYAVIYAGEYFDAAFAKAVMDSSFWSVFGFIMYFLPIVTGIGALFLVMWNDKNDENASKGAMDNATGIGLGYAVTKYYKDHPEKMPKNCRIIDFNCGSEEASLRGSIAFTREHKGEDILKNAWNINIDSIADEEYFEVVIKDDWQMTRFDKDLEQMFKDTFKEMKIESKTNGCIHNPVGGCDSTPLTKAGVKSVTFAAQNPVLTYYYHTFRDTPDRFDVNTVGTGFDVIVSVIDKIADYQQKNGFTGVNN